MFTKTVTYKDFDGNERTEVCRFNLSEPEIIEMETSYPGGLEQMLKKIIEEKDQQKILAVFKELMLKSYGENFAIEFTNGIMPERVRQAASQVSADVIASPIA